MRGRGMPRDVPTTIFGMLFPPTSVDPRMYDTELYPTDANTGDIP
mgnify:CR=1 FL=1